MSQPKMKDRPILLRLPERQIIILDNIVKNSQRKYKSRNDLVTEIIEYFIEELRQGAQRQVMSHENR